MRLTLLSRLFQRTDRPQVTDITSSNRAEVVNRIGLIDTLDKERDLFWRTLDHFIPKTPFTFSPDMDISVLNVACGSCSEAYSIDSYFGGREINERSTNVVQVCIDKKPEKIDAAIIENPHQRIKFICDDLVAPKFPEEIPKDVDVVIIRHQESDSGEPKMWSSIFQSSLDRLTTNGIILITSSTYSQHKIMLRIMRRLGAVKVVDGENPITRNGLFASMDRNVAIFQKGNPRRFRFWC